MNKNFINFHVLISHSPSCLNRDDMNMQKSAMFGGKRRVRISSQSLKRTIRTSDYYKERFDKSSRTRKLVNNIVEEQLKNCSDKDKAKQIEQSGLYLAALVEGKTKPEDIKKYKRANSGNIEHQILPFHDDEIKKMKDLFLKSIDKAEDKKIDFLKAGLKSIQDEEKGNITLDVAISGRMATSEYMYPIEGAIAVAHAITTHTVDADIDWFTAVDDLQELGSGHLDTQEFSSGVFYRYASLNIKQLQENLGNAPREKALEIAAHVLHMLATEVPSAKQQSFAAHNLADLAMVSFSDLPVSLANAFEEPVKAASSGGFLKTSIKELHNYWQSVHSGYGLNERCAEFMLGTVEVPTDIKPISSLEDLKSWIQGNGEG